MYLCIYYESVRVAGRAFPEHPQNCVCPMGIPESTKNKTRILDKLGNSLGISFSIYLRSKNLRHGHPKQLKTRFYMDHNILFSYYMCVYFE